MHRIAKLARQLAPEVDAPSTSSSVAGLARAPTAAAADDARSLPPPPFFQGRVILITGAAAGIGAACAKLYARHGAAGLVLTDLDAVALARVKEECAAIAAAASSSSSRPIKITTVAPLDITSPEAPSKLRAAVERDHQSKLHVLVNNAGYTRDGVLHRMPDASFAAMMDVHVSAPFRLLRDVCGPLMRDAAKREQEKEASNASSSSTITPRFVVNVSSTSGTHGNAGQANYAAAKAAVVGLTKTVAKEWGPLGVRCNCVAFGLIDTRLTREREGGEAIVVGGERVALGIPNAGAMRAFVETMAPLRRVGTAEEAAGAVLFLSCEWASFVTGQCLEVNGGSYM